jgi:2-polyprenyl-3-methyl-5-hydroxy-6-metoxy-1,4-benzoquinol methylase
MQKLEVDIKNKFNEMVFSPMFPAELDADDPQLAEVLEWFGDIENKNILDAGCAKGRFSKALVDMGAKIKGIDPSESFISIARENVPDAEFDIASVTDIPYDDNSFDGVLCLEVLEHVPDTEKAISEMARVLKPGGKIIIIDKNILSLEPIYLMPTFLYKKIQEYRNKWMYPRNFPFREKYFTFGHIDRLLRKYCGSVHSRYLPNGRTPKAGRFYKIIPSLSFDIAWRAIK